MTLRRTGDWQRSAPLARTPLAAPPLARRAAPLRARPFRPSRPSVSREERKARRLVAERADGRCEGCGWAGPTEWAHRVSRAHKGPWNAANGLALCGSAADVLRGPGVLSCHSWSHSVPIEARSVGWLLRSTDDFLTFSVLLHGRGFVRLGGDGTYLPVPDQGDAA